MSTVISVENISKRYRLGEINRGMLYQDIQSWWAKIQGKEDPNAKLHDANASGLSSREFWALQDVSFAVNQGESVALIGKNGAGKSTLLKILSRITGPTTGQIRLKGRLTSLLEVGTGFHGELSGRDNVFLNGAILGMNRWEISQKLNSIIEFSGLEKFIDTPVKRYSSGMYVRLAFAVAAHLNSDILVLDEVLAVGDAEFQKRCFAKMGEVANAGRTVLFVSHNLTAVQSLCQKGIILQQGRVTFKGTSTEAVEQYLLMERGRVTRDLSLRKDRQGEGNFRFNETWVQGTTGQPIDTVRCGETVRIHIRYSAEKSLNLQHITIAVGLRGPFGETISALSSTDCGFDSGKLSHQGEIVCEIPQLPLNIGQYSFTLFASIGSRIQDWVQEAGSFYVEGGDFFGTGKIPDRNQGFFLMKHHWEVI